MKFLANEIFPLSSIRILKEAGSDIIGVGIEFQGVSDEEVIGHATSENRTILTFDRDYGELIFQKGLRPNAGVIFLRWDSFHTDDPGKYLVELIRSKTIQFEKMLTVIGEKTIRQRRIE